MPDIRASTLDEEWAGRSDKQRRADSSSREALLSAATDNSTLLYPTGQRTASTSQPDGDKASQVQDRPSNQESSSSRREGESPQVLLALDRAEELAKLLLQPGGVTPERRKELESAIADAEAAMSQVAQKLESK